VAMAHTPIRKPAKAMLAKGFPPGGFLDAGGRNEPQSAKATISRPVIMPPLYPNCWPASQRASTSRNSQVMEELHPRRLRFRQVQFILKCLSITSIMPLQNPTGETAN